SWFPPRPHFTNITCTLIAQPTRPRHSNRSPALTRRRFLRLVCLARQCWLQGCCRWPLPTRSVKLSVLKKACLGVFEKLRSLSECLLFLLRLAPLSRSFQACR